ncbi:hypothetical protein [Sphingomonas montanisoli]|nr:hypothetical protein [Sphingomonas montanisoli]
MRHDLSTSPDFAASRAAIRAQLSKLALAERLSHGRIYTRVETR